MYFLKVSIYTMQTQILCYYSDDCMVQWKLFFKTHGYEAVHNSYSLGQGDCTGKD